MRNPSSKCLLAFYFLTFGDIRAPLARAQTPGATVTAPQTPPGPTGAISPASTPPSTPAPVPKPRITAILPAAPVAGPNQPLTLTGADFQDKPAVTFTSPQGSTYPATVLSSDRDRLIVLGTLGTAGKWKVSATNPGGPVSDPLEFPVAISPSLDYTSPSVLGFLATASVVTILIGALLGFMLYDLHKAQQSGQWSLGNALSEESSFQPKEINQKSDVIMFASTSRLIALVGLMGILGVVIAIGYSIAWNLYVYGNVPDISQIRSFLLGSATLFAPYLANQLTGMFTPSAKTKPADTQPSTSLTGVAPASPIAAPGPQPLHLTGLGYQTGLSLTFTDPLGGTRTAAGPAITTVTPTLTSANVTLDTPGLWKVTVANPATDPSAAFTFTVFGPPTVTAVDPAQPVHNANAQKLTFIGTGFISGLTVQFTPPPPAGGAAAAPTAVQPDSVTATRVVISASLVNAGNGQVVITNPGNYASAAFPITVI